MSIENENRKRIVNVAKSYVGTVGGSSKMEQVDEPTTQTETQNSNLTFEKDECAKEYEELGLKELKELIKIKVNKDSTK